MRKQVRWGEAVRAARTLLARCQTVAGERFVWDEKQRLAEVERWALLVYATAGEISREPGAVSPAELRYRLGDNAQRWGIWLGAQLQRLGHRVAQPTPPSPAQARSDLAAAATVLASAQAAARTDDAVVRTWVALTPITGGTSEIGSTGAGVARAGTGSLVATMMSR